MSVPSQDKHWGSLGALVSCVNLHMPLLNALGRVLLYSSHSSSHFQLQPGSLPFLAPASSSPSS